jgi:predicted ATPase
LERALAIFRPGRDDDLAYRFGHDLGVAAMVYLAIALWPLGDVMRAASLIEAAQQRLTGITHVGTRAHGRVHLATFEVMRGNPSRAAPSASELVRLARDHDLHLFRAFGTFLEGWTKAQGGALTDGLEEMRVSAELLRSQSVGFDGLYKGALARVEAEAGDPARALAILEKALATSERIGHRAFDAELHRTRGEILLNRDPSNPAPAEEAFQISIAIAKRQAARSFALRAARSLARLYQSIGRPAAANAVLVPALEGFAPTPEMPEIAEAQALIESFA